jgi:5-methyltetrahydrofolate--homocysteine methyltransferase
MDRPDQVRAADQYLMDLWCHVYDRFHQITCEAAQGSTCWFRLWSPGKFYAVQNDFSYMISPRMFEEIFLPTIEKQTTFLDHTVYHVDGVGAFAHVEALCALSRLQALQILPGAGKPSPLHYMDVLKRVQAAGKNLHITIPPEEVETALSELSARGLFINTHCETEDDARALLTNAQQWSRDRP